MSILQQIDDAKSVIPKYWPIGSFIHHNPLYGFEHLHFKDGVKEAKKIFGGEVYMDSSYYMKQYEDGNIDLDILENNINYILKEEKIDTDIDFAKKFLMDVSPKWKDLRIKLIHKKEKIDNELYEYIKKFKLSLPTQYFLARYSLFLIWKTQPSFSLWASNSQYRTFCCTRDSTCIYTLFWSTYVGGNFYRTVFFSIHQ